MHHDFNTILDLIFNDHELLHLVFSTPRLADSAHKVTIRPVVIQERQLFQLSEFREEQVFHKNLDASSCRKMIESTFRKAYKRALFCCKEADFHWLSSKKGKETIVKRSPSHQAKTLEHNIRKNYILSENQPIPFLIALGISSPAGRVLPKKMDKFRQLNRFLEMIRDLLPHFPDKTIRIIDFGCGKAYLTFALYYYLSNIEKLNVHIEGLDLKKTVIEECNQLAKKLHYSHLHFSVGDIAHYSPKQPPDMVICLHACNTATDDALAQAVSWNAKVILAVPCCQHELLSQIQSKTLHPLLKHGILKERFAALVTDAVRAQRLEMAGYQTDVIEFIDLEHTPKNLMIRAIKHNSNPPNSLLQEEYHLFKQFLNLKS